MKSIVDGGRSRDGAPNKLLLAKSQRVVIGWFTS